MKNIILTIFCICLLSNSVIASILPQTQLSVNNNINLECVSNDIDIAMPCRGAIQVNLNGQKGIKFRSILSQYNPLFIYSLFVYLDGQLVFTKSNFNSYGEDVEILFPKNEGKVFISFSAYNPASGYLDNVSLFLLNPEFIN